MKITIKQSGGFAGIEQELKTLDSTRMTAPEAETFNKTLGRLNVACAQRIESEGADRISYEVEIEDKGQPTKRLRIVDEGDSNDPAIREVHALLAIGEKK